MPDIDHQGRANLGFLRGVSLEVVLALIGLVHGKALELERHAPELEGDAPDRVQQVVRVEVDVLGGTTRYTTVVPFVGI
ncbi:hypothetical protein D3C80_2115490 [compost metagenome]